MKVSVSAALALGSVLAITASAEAARPGVEGFTPTPIQMTIDGVAAFKDTKIVVFGCISEDEQHVFSIAKTTGPLRCHVRGSPIVYAVPVAAMGPIDAVYAKNLGRAAELEQVRGLLEQQPSCGMIHEQTLSENDSRVALIEMHYAIDRGDVGCAMRKVKQNVWRGADGSPVDPAEAPPPRRRPAPAASSGGVTPQAVTPASTPTPTTEAPKKGGCGSCTTASTSTFGDAGGGIGLALAVAATLGRRGRRGVRSS